MESNIDVSEVNWHHLAVDEVLKKEQVSPEDGLGLDAVSARQKKYGSNELIERGVKSRWLILWEQFTDTMVIVLIIAAVISVILGDWKDAIAILAIVVLNAVLGFVQEYRAEQAMAALKKMSAPIVKVRRAGHVDQIPSQDLVPGDVVLLEAGDAIPADSRLVETANLRVQEASLTGESLPVDKSTEVITGENTPLGDRRNMLYMGTTVSYGRGIGVVVETGMRTQLGRIADLIQAVETEQTPLQKKMAQLGKSLAWVALAIVGLVFVLGLLRGEPAREMFFTAIAMAVAAIPEGLPAVVTISLALGAQRMLRRQALIRKLPAVETLGSVTTICSDKTGTLTENKMTVTILDVLDNTRQFEAFVESDVTFADADITPDAEPPVRTLALLVKAAALCNDAVLEFNAPLDSGYRMIGDPTEGALLVAAAKLDMLQSDLKKRWPRVDEIPFSSVRKRMTTIHITNIPEGDLTDAPWKDAKYVAFSKGAPDRIIDKCNKIWMGETLTLDDDIRSRIEAANDKMASEGQRMLAVAFKPLDEKPGKESIDAVEDDMVFIGLVAMLDPPRKEVLGAVQTSKTAGIRPIMITGDHPLTAQRIAQDLGIIDDNGRVLTGQKLDAMQPGELDTLVETVSVYARVSPEHKLNIVQALQKKGEIVAMTGDGVNDAPALRKADIGVAMGITGTDVAKEASEMVLLDDNFATIVNAIEEGRTIYDNVRKFIKYTMTSNAGEIYVMLFAPFLGMPLPLSALQILWINLVTDGLPGLALAVEPAERNTMRRPPYAPTESVFARGMGLHIVWVGLMMGLISLLPGYWGWSEGLDFAKWTTMVFTTLTLAQMAHATAVRSRLDSLFTQGIFSNKPLVAAVSLTFVLQMLVVYWPPLQEIFGTTGLNAMEFGICLGLSATVFIAVEIEKFFKRRQLNK